MAACEGLVQYDKTGVSTALNAVLELYAGKLARTVLRGPRFREEMRLPSRGVAVAGPYLRSDAGKLGETALLQFSALVSAMGWINDMMLAKGLRRLARPVSVARYFSRA